jgi:hypothetical protein
MTNLLSREQAPPEVVRRADAIASAVASAVRRHGGGNAHAVLNALAAIMADIALHQSEPLLAARELGDTII